MGASASGFADPCFSCLFVEIDDNASAYQHRQTGSNIPEPLDFAALDAEEEALGSGPYIDPGLAAVQLPLGTPPALAAKVEVAVSPGAPAAAAAAAAAAADPAPAEKRPAEPTPAEEEPERTPVASEEERHGKEGIESFFDIPTAGSEAVDPAVIKTDIQLVDDGASLAHLLAKVEELGNVNLALQEEARRQNAVRDTKAAVRVKAMRQFLAVMGEGGPGLRVKKYHRSGGKGEKGKWAPRVIRYAAAQAGDEGSGGTITWDTRRLFARESSGVDICDIVKVESSGKFVWISVDGSTRLAFETRRSLDALLLSRCIEYLMEDVYGEEIDISADEAAP
ncbi:unnamed protein product, partial [Phaeothamnion confervicola]